MSPILVAVSHELAEDGGGSDRLMSTACYARFLKDVVPLITNSSLILCEGFYHPTLIGRDDSRYPTLQEYLLDLPRDLSPTLGGVDFRQQQIRTAEDHDRLGERQDRWERVAKDLLRFDYGNIPTSLEAMVATLRARSPRIHVLHTPTNEQRNLAREIGSQSRKFNRLYLDELRTHARKFNRCFFVGGAVHVVAMAVKTGYRVISLVPNEELAYVLEAYLAEYYGTRHIMNARPER